MAVEEETEELTTVEEGVLVVETMLEGAAEGAATAVEAGGVCRCCCC